MTAFLPVQNCWREIGVWGDRSCSELKTHSHCHNCGIYASAGRNLLQRQPPPGYIQEWTAFFQQTDEQTDPKTLDTLSLGIFRLGTEWLSFYRKNAVKPCTLGQGCKAHTVLSSQTCDKIAV
jgi:chemotaxis-related protein WspD